MLTISDEESLECKCLPSRVLRAELFAKLHSGECAAVTVATATQRASLAPLPLFALESSLALVQTQASLAPAIATRLITSGALAARHSQPHCSPAHACAWGLARVGRAESSLPIA